MQDDRISIELRLPGVMVLEVKEEEHWIEVVGQYRAQEADCPKCGRSAWQVHQWHLQRKRDARLWRKQIWLARLWRGASAAAIAARCSRNQTPLAGRAGEQRRG